LQYKHILATRDKNFILSFFCVASYSLRQNAAHLCTNKEEIFKSANQGRVKLNATF